jgi:hypothetical protein
VPKSAVRKLLRYMSFSKSLLLFKNHKCYVCNQLAALLFHIVYPSMKTMKKSKMNPLRMILFKKKRQLIISSSDIWMVYAIVLLL